MTAPSWWATDLAAHGPGIAAVDPPDLPQQCDVAVVGAGFAGLSTAWHLARAEPDLRIAVFDAGDVGHGASGRNGGWLLPFPAVLVWLFAGSLPADHRRWALEAVTELLGATADHLRDQGAPVQPTLAVVESRSRLVARNFGWLARTATDLGLPGEVWDAGTVHDVCGGSGRAALAVPAYRIQPLALARHIAGLIRRAGVTIHERTPVIAATPTREGAVVATAAGRVHATTVVVCTNAYAPALAPRRARRRVVHSYMCATEELPSDVLARLGGEAHLVASVGAEGMIYRRVHGRRLLFGALDVGRLAPTETAATDPRSRARLRALLRHHLPWLWSARVDHEWGGPFVRSATDLPLVRHDPRSRHIVWNLGYGGGGVALSLASGRLARGLVHPDLDDPVARRLRAAYADTRLPVLGLVRSQVGLAVATYRGSRG